MLGGTVYESANTILERAFNVKYKLGIKVSQKHSLDMYSYSSSFHVTVNGVIFTFTTSSSHFEKAIEELFELIKKKDIPDLWIPYNVGSTVGDDTMIIMSGIFQIKHIAIGGMFQNKATNSYAQEVTIHGILERYIFTGDLYRDFKKEVAEYFMERYPEYLI